MCYSLSYNPVEPMGFPPLTLLTFSDWAVFCWWWGQSGPCSLPHSHLLDAVGKKPQLRHPKMCPDIFTRPLQEKIPLQVKKPLN